MFVRNIGIVVLILILIAVLGGKIYSLKGPDTDSLPKDHSFGIEDGLLAPCRERPNCVCTDHAGANYMDPIPLEDSVHNLFRDSAEALNGCQVVDSNDNYLRLECKTPFFNFIDDVELFHDTDKEIIRFRSASRLGYYDFGVNRKRMEKLKDWLENKR